MIDEQRHAHDVAARANFLHIAQLETQVGRMVDHLDGLEEQLQPVLERRQPVAEVEDEEKMIDPIHDLHALLVRFEDANRRLDKIRSRIRL